MKRGRLLVYTTDGESESVWPPPGESWLGARSPSHPPEIDAVVAVKGSVVLAAYELKLGFDGTPASSEASLVLLDRTLRPSSVLDWRWEMADEAPEASSPLTFVDELLAVGARLFVWGGSFDDPLRPVLMAVSVDPGSDDTRASLHRSSLREEARWTLLQGESQFLSALPIRSLASDGNEGAELAYALRLAAAPFIQILTPSEGGISRLSSFPESVSSLPELPQTGGWDSLAPFFAAAESSSYPAGLYGRQGRLYVLARDVVDDFPVWDLHHVDPVKDEIVGRTRLPTNAAHVSLLPGEKYWVLEESSSFADDMFRQPTRLLLLDSEAVRAGEELRCD